MSNIEQITENYTKKAIFKSEENENIYDSFDELFSKLDLISYIDNENHSDLNTGVWLYVEDMKEHLRGIELQMKREIMQGTLK